MAELYVTLVSGRTVHVCSDWDGAAPTRIGTVDATGAPADGEGIEAGEYYRDIHRYNAQVFPAEGSLVVTSVPPNTAIEQTGSAAITVQAALVPSTTVQAKTVEGAYSQFTNTTTSLLTKGLVPDSVTAQPSDEVAKLKPRTWQKVSTWLVFTGTAGTYQWRAASVDGWSSKAPID